MEVLLYKGADDQVPSAHPLQAEGNGYFSALIAPAAPASLYRYRLDGGAAFPDPASRFQPEGPHGPSQVVDPAAFAWTDSGWKGISIEGQVIYEMHIGTFTREGTWAAAAVVRRQAGRMRRLLDDLLDVARIDGGNLQIGREAVDIKALVEEIAEDFCVQAESAGVSIEVDAPAALPNVVGDGGRLLQGLSNLVSNALKFTPPGGAYALRLPMMAARCAC